MPVVNSKQIWTTDIRAQINGAYRILEPPAFLPLSGGGGGVRNRGCISPTAMIVAPRSTTREAIPDPPRLSTFKRRGGGVRNPGCIFPTAAMGEPRSTAHRRSRLPRLSLFKPAWSLPRHAAFCASSLLATFPHLAMWQGPFPLASPRPPAMCLSTSTHSHHLPCVPFPPRQPPTKCVHCVSSPASSAYLLLPCVSPVTSLTPSSL
jgi:hypothetical protein